MRFLERVIINSPFYNFLRFFPVLDFIYELKTGKTKKNKFFFQSYLPDNLQDKLAFDVGSNKGNKTKALLALGMRVVCIEPELKCLNTLHYRFNSNKKVDIINKGLSYKDGEMTLYIQGNRSGYNTFSKRWVDELQSSAEKYKDNTSKFTKEYHVKITTLDNLIEEYGMPFYIKVDVEGFEKEVFEGLNTSVPYISFEANLPKFREETISIVHRLGKLYNHNIEFKIAIDEQINDDKWMDETDIENFILLQQKSTLEIVCRERKFPSRDHT